MNMRKVFKQMLAIVAAGAMTMGLAMPVFAEGAGTTNIAKEAYISKTFNTEVGKNETFSFKAEQVEGNTAQVTIPDISFTDSETGSKTKRAKVTFPEKWPDAGKYEYTVTETGASPAITDTKHQTMIMSQAEYTMDVYVSNVGDKLEISNIIVNNKKDDKGQTKTGKVDISDTDANGFKFTNTYVQEAGTGTDPTNPDPTYGKDGSLNVTKKIVANGGTVDAEKEFDFTATFTFPTGTDASTLGGVKANGSDITLKAGGTYDFTLTNGGNEKFTGLPVGTTMTVTESATPNYKGSAAVVINGVTQDTVTASKYDEAITVSGKKLGQKKNAVDVTNTYNNVPVTGIIMNNLPYIAMIVIGAAALVVYVQNKRKNLQ